MGINNGAGGIDSDDDDDEDGWVHGGKYVPAAANKHQRSKQHQHHQPPSSTPADNEVTAPSSVANTNNNNNNMPSPYSMLSPPALTTPLSQEGLAPSTQRVQEQEEATTPRINSVRTPFTVQLQRLLQPTPAPQTTNTSVATTTPTAAVVNTPIPQQQHPQRGHQQQPPLPPATPMETFLTQSGVTPSASHIIGEATTNVVTNFFSLLLAILSVVWNNLTLMYKYNNHLATIANTTFPGLAAAYDVIASIYDLGLELCQFAWKTVQLVAHSFQFVAPYVLWTIQTCIALVLTIGGTILWGMVWCVRGRKRADASGAGSVQSSAMKSLKESVRNSPFRKKGRLPFSGFSDALAVPSPNDDVPRQRQQRQSGYPVANARQLGNASNGVLASTLATTSTSSNKSTMTTNHPPPAANATIRSTATPPISAIRSNLKQTPRISSSAATTTPATANTRRVLFSETENGKVSTQPFYYDKTLPASARKADPRSRLLEGEGEEEMNSRTVGGMFGGQQRHRRFAGTPPREESPAASLPAAAAAASSASPVLRPSKYFEPNQTIECTEETKSRKATSQPGRNVASASGRTAPSAQPTTTGAKAQPAQQQPAAASKKSQEQLAEEEEKTKQQYIQRYGLLPTITPLSKRYGRMKRQQQEGQRKPAALGSASTKTASNPTGTSTVNAGANVAINKSNINDNAKRKRRGDLLGAASRMGRNRRARLGTVRNANGAASSLPTVLLGRNRTPKRRRDEESMSRTDEWVWRAMNHDEKENRRNELQGESVAKRSKFSVPTTATNVDEGPSTPPKNPTVAGLSSTLPPIMTPPKTPGPSNFSGFGSATPAPKKKSSGDDGVANTATPSKPSIPFSFGDDDDDDAPDTKDGTAGFSFGATTAGTEKKDTSAADFTTAGVALFGASAAPPAPVSEKKDAGAFAFGASSSQPAEQSKEATSSGAAFSFGAGATPDPATGTAPAPVAAFGFGASAQPAPASDAQTKDPAASSSGGAFSFGTSAPAPAVAGAAPPFGFGASSAQPTASAGVAPTPPATFGFGTSAAPAPAIVGTAPVASPATFGFGASSAQPAAAAVPTPAAAPFGFGTSAPAPATFGFGASSAAQPAAPTPAAAPFAFGAQPTAQQPSTFSFGGAGASSAPPAALPNFGGATAAAPATDTFNLGGAAAAGSFGRSSGASARRRAAKSGGRRR